MTTPAPDWADEISLAACGPTEQGLYVANALRAAYERGKAEKLKAGELSVHIVEAYRSGERLGHIKGLREAAKMADTGMLVPPDGGSPTEDECEVARRIAIAIRARIDELEAEKL